MRIRLFLLCATAALLGSACQLDPVTCDQTCEDSWMGGGLITDSTAHDSLLSVRLPNPDSADFAKHVIIAVHGYTATTYEWKEFKDSAEDWDSTVLVSAVLLGGHGTNFADFENSTWQDWGQPILDEYRALAALGYKHLSLAGSSTGCTLILQFVHDHAFDSLPKPENIFLIDPIVVPSAKILSAVDFLEPIIANSPSPGDSTENAHWYVNRPSQTLAQLYTLINLVKNELTDGFYLPAGTRCKEYKALYDASSDPVSALYIDKGIRQSDGSRIEAEMVDSHLHVFTRLLGRDPGSLTAADTLLQRQTFQDMLARVKAWPQ